MVGKKFHWDIFVAFTNADADELTYVVFPPNFPSDICPGYAGGAYAVLAKNLYGSKTAPRLWYKCLSEFLIEIGFRSVAGHPCLFICFLKIEGEVYVVIMGIFVDDLLVTGFPPKAIDHAERQLSESFEYTYQGEVVYYLGVEFTQVGQHNLLLHQLSHIESVLEIFKLKECKPVFTPLPLTS